MAEHMAELPEAVCLVLSMECWACSLAFPYRFHEVYHITGLCLDLRLDVGMNQRREGLSLMSVAIQYYYYW